MTEQVGPQDRYRQDLGVYLAGGLEPDERAAIEAHLPTCAGCQADLARLAPLPGLLRRLQAADLGLESAVQPPPSLLEGVLAATAARRRVEQRALRFWRGATLAALAAAAAVTIVLVLPAASPSRFQTAALEPVALSSARGTVDIHPRPWGTQLILNLSGLPAGVECEAWIMSGRTRTPIGTWGPTETHRAEITVATSARSTQLALLITTSTGRTLLAYYA